MNRLQQVQEVNYDMQGLIEATAQGKDIRRAPYNKMKQHIFISHGALYVNHNHNMLAVIPPQRTYQFIIQSHQDPLHSHIGAKKN